MVALKASAPARHTTIERLRTLADEVEKLPHVHLRRAQGVLVDELPERPDGFSMGTFLERQPELGVVADIGGVAACVWGLKGGGAVDPVSQVLRHLGLGVLEGMSLMAPLPADVPERPDMETEELTPAEACHACRRLASHIEAVRDGLTESLSLDPAALTRMLWR